MGTQTYVHPPRQLPKPLYSMHIACRRWVFAIAALWPLVFASCSGNSDASSFISEASRTLADSFESSKEAIEEMQVRARTVAVRLHTDALAIEMDDLQGQLEEYVRTLAALPDAESLPWNQWVHDTWKTLPELSEQYMLCAEHLLRDEAALLVARGTDIREMPIKVRLIAHRMLWNLDPNEALARGNILLFRERPRSSDRMRPLYVEELLIPSTHPFALDLLLDVAASDTMESRARTMAIRALGDSDSIEAPAILESVFDTESVNFLVRKEALLSILKLDPPRAHSMLETRLPQQSVEPGLWEFMQELREQENLNAPAQD
jgi:hypothetical protein